LKHFIIIVVVVVINLVLMQERIGGGCYGWRSAPGRCSNRWGCSWLWKFRTTRLADR